MTLRRLTSRLCIAAVCALVVSSSSSCTLLWIFNSDPAGLPCDFTAGQTGVCLDGYTCVEQAQNEFICVAAGALGVGEPCVSSDQCDENLTCDTAYGPACEGDGADDPNCSLVPNIEKARACRQICDNTNSATCPENTFCFDAEPDFCQAGVCTTDSDCEVVAGSGALCSGEILNEGKSGLCFQNCDPLVCNPTTGVCPDCTGVDGVVDTDQTCIPVADEPGVSNRNVCGLAGTLAPFADCSTGEGCAHGSFCGQLGDGSLQCVQWCRAAAGNPAPACPTGSICTPLAGELGICQR